MSIESSFVSRWWGYGIAGVILAFCISSISRFIEPAQMWAAGLSLSMGIVALYEAHIEQGRSRNAFFPVGVLMAVIGVIVFGAITVRATTDAKLNDRRCLAIQRDMLASQPLRSDGPDLFQALGCRPQGGGSVHAKARVK